MTRQRLRESSIKWEIQLSVDSFALKIIKLLEGQASGLPTLTFDRTALSERVINKMNGYKVKSFDEMGKKALELVINESKWLYLSNKSINLSKKYSWKSVAISWHNYLKKINLEKFN